RHQRPPPHLDGGVRQGDERPARRRSAGEPHQRYGRVARGAPERPLPSAEAGTMTTNAEDEAKELRPRPFGKYQLLKKLATGGMAEIWVARAQGISGVQQICVVKRILPELASSTEFV